MTRIIGMGDSVMKGIVTDSANICEGTLKYKICDRNFMDQLQCTKRMPVLNLARFGNTAMGGIKCLNRHLKEIQPDDMVVLEFGGNDCNFDWASIAQHPECEHLPHTSVKDFRNAYISILKAILGMSAHPVMLSLPALDSQLFFNFISRGLCRENILRWLGGDVNAINNWHEQYNLEIFKIGASMNVPVIDISSIFLSKRNLRDYYCEDGMHPNEAGHELIAQAIANYQLPNN